MLVGVEQELYCQPAHPAVREQSWDTRPFKRIGRRLEYVIAAQGLVYKRQRGVRRGEEEGIIVAADGAVEGGDVLRYQTICG